MSVPEQAKRTRRRAGRWLRRAVGATLAISVLALALPCRGGVEGEARVVDGDTLEVAGERIRLHGIDAPESEQSCERDGLSYACGAAATDWLQQHVQTRPVRCEEEGRDRYGRLLAVCFAGDENLNKGMVEAGWALAYRRFSTRFLPEELDAIHARRGLWAGRFVPPWQWRHGETVMVDAGSEAFQTAVGTQLEVAGEPADEETCPVKANVGASGSRIYHVPGDSHYDRLRLDPVQGDRCFDSEAAAAAAGFRPARR